MRTILLAVLLAAAIPLAPARAWMQERPGGGYTHTGYAGGYQHSTTVTSQGVAHSSDLGGYEHGTAAGPNGVAHASNAGGAWHGTAANSQGAVHANGYGTTSSYYHQPAVVNNYNATCINCRPPGYAAPVAVGVTAGIVAGAAVASTAHPVYAAPPAVYAALPAGCAYRPVLHQYECGGVWLAPAYGANGVYYTPVPPP